MKNPFEELREQVAQDSTKQMDDDDRDEVPYCVWCEEPYDNVDGKLIPNCECDFN